jgi:hypothetical protein
VLIFHLPIWIETKSSGGSTRHSKIQGLPRWEPPTDTAARSAAFYAFAICRPLPPVSMLRAILRNVGVDPQRILPALRGWRSYVRDRNAFLRMNHEESFAWGKELPILTERGESSGSLGAYFFQDPLVAT